MTGKGLWQPVPGSLPSSSGGGSSSSSSTSNISRSSNLSNSGSSRGGSSQDSNNGGIWRKRLRSSVGNGHSGEARFGLAVLVAVALLVILLGAITLQRSQSCTQQTQLLVQTHTQADAGTQANALPAAGGFAPHHIAQAGSACDKHNGTQGLQVPLSEALVAPVVIVAHKRVHYLAKCITTLLRYWETDPANERRFPLYVSVDGGDHNAVQFAAAFHFSTQMQVIHNIPDSSRCKNSTAYCNISVHYQMLLELFFECRKAPRLIFLEEDLEIAPDLFSYFAEFAPMLDRDDSLMCVSAWNDHGQRGRVSNASAVYRTDIFPGLGWMLGADFAREIIPDWPDMWWDEYMRRPQTRKGRQCLFPEVSRTHTYGRDGASKGQGYATYLVDMVLSSEDVNWHGRNSSYLEGAAYSQQMAQWVAAAQPIVAGSLRHDCSTRHQHQQQDEEDLVVHYHDEKSFRRIASSLYPMMPDLKGQHVSEKTPRPIAPVVPRASYNGITIVRCQGRRLFIVPEPGSEADPTSEHWRSIAKSAALEADMARNSSIASSNGSSSSSNSSSSSRSQTASAQAAPNMRETFGDRSAQKQEGNTAVDTVSLHAQDGALDTQADSQQQQLSAESAMHDLTGDELVTEKNRERRRKWEGRKRGSWAGAGRLSSMLRLQS